MKNIRFGSFAWIIFILCALSVRADITLWSEDFSDVSDWNIVFNSQGDASSITSDGSLGEFYVQAINNEVAFAPTTSFGFDPLNASDYNMEFTVDNLTGSVSYDIRLDMFDNSSSYLGTVFGVVPQGTFTGSDTVNLGGFAYNPSTESLAIKISAFTGPTVTDQSVFFDSVRFSVVPEPSSVLFIAMGSVLLFVRRLKR